MARIPRCVPQGAKCLIARTRPADGEGMRQTSVRFSDDKVRLAAIVGAVLVLSVALSVIFTVTRYDKALGKATDVSAQSAALPVAREATAAFWRERAAMTEYLLVPSPEYLDEVHDQASELERITGILEGASPAQQAAVKRARAGNAAFVQAFERIRSAAGTARGAETKANGVLDTREQGVLTPLLTLHALASQDVARSQRTSASTAGDAHLAAIVTAVAGILLTLFVFFTLIVIRRLLASIRGTAIVLGTSVEELRASSRDSAAAASEQSAAVAETSATIEELAVTARSISDNARVVADAAEQTGETMRDMQEQVDAIAQRSLSLGERSQEIGEILELINEIAEQTNLLALNAAIEAARAGDAGRGFAVVASEVRKLAERSLKSSDSIRQIIGGVQNEANATIMATEQGARQAREVGELMGSTASMLEQSILATQQQRSAADQVAEAMIQIREAAGQLAADQTQRDHTSERLEDLIASLEQSLDEAGGSTSPVAPDVRLRAA
jgi:methyl-accepting chemotaxis protein